MLPAENSSHEPTTYVVDAEAALEMARLLQQDQLMTEHLGGLFPERSDMTGIERILDLACGPGGWALQCAHTYPEITVVGIDKSHRVIAYAQTQAFVHGTTNTHFQLMDILTPLDFPDGSFDLINARLILGFMTPTAWPKLLQECRRLLRPGGILRLTEAEYGLANGRTFERVSALFTTALYKAGQSFSPDGRHIGITPMLGRLLRQGGYQEVNHLAAAIEFSVGTPAHESVYQNMMTLLQLIPPFLLHWEVTTQEEFAALSAQFLDEMRQEDFCGVCYYLTAWGSVPLEKQ